MWRKVKGVLPLVLVLVMLFAFGLPVFAATSATVDINATPSYISIAVNNTSFDFSTVVIDTDEQTATGYFGINNTSTVTSTTTIVADGWTVVSGGSGAWTWGAPASDQCQLKASDGDAAWDVTIDDTTPVNIKVSQAADTDWVFEIQIDAATAYTHGDEQETTITLACAAA